MIARLVGNEVILRMSLKEARWSCKNDGIALKQTNSLGVFSPNALHERYNAILDCLLQHKKNLTTAEMYTPHMELCLKVLRTISANSSKREYTTVQQIAEAIDADLDNVIDVILWFQNRATGVIFIDGFENVDGTTKCYSTGAVDYWLFLLNSLDRDYDYA